MLLFVTVAREAATFATEHHSGLSIRGRVLSVSSTVSARLSLWFLKKFQMNTQEHETVQKTCNSKIFRLVWVAIHTLHTSTADIELLSSFFPKLVWPTYYDLGGT